MLAIRDLSLALCAIVTLVACGTAAHASNDTAATDESTVDTPDGGAVAETAVVAPDTVLDSTADALALLDAHEGSDAGGVSEVAPDVATDAALKDAAVDAAPEVETGPDAADALTTDLSDSQASADIATDATAGDAGDVAPDASDAGPAVPFGSLFGHACKKNADCGTLLSCNKAGCSDIGACEFSPDICPAATGSPICGCDGQTYASPCVAMLADTGVASSWACGTQPPWTPCTVSILGTCGPGQYCNGPCGGLGACQPAGGFMSCYDQLWYTKGCNGQTYINDCGPSQNGVAAVDPGAASLPCIGPGQFTDCANGTACISAAGSCPALPAFDGHCMPLPTACPKVLAPVCGCNGVTYDNACLALKAGTSAYASGPCASGFQVCNMFAQCPVGQTCEYLACGPDASGLCVHTSVSCTGGTPVCGCSGTTFASECLLIQAGVGKFHDGACP